jgi:D-alanyl-D-alanine carboxypeptidase
MRNSAFIAGALAISLFSARLNGALPSLTSAEETQVTLTLEGELKRQRLPGAIVAIQRDGCAPFIVARGIANYRTHQPIDAQMHVRIGSVTKSFVTSLLLLLAQKRQLSLDDPISRYIADVPNGDLITLRQLANMTSGLDGYTSNPNFAVPFYLNEQFTPDQLIQLGITLPPLFAPGTRWSYSNTNTVLLGRVIELVTGQPLAAVLRQRLFRPLGLGDTSVPSGVTLPRPFARGYTTQTINGQFGEATFYTASATWAAGGAVSTAGDLLRAARFFATGEPLLSAATQRQRMQWVKFPPNSRIQSYGLGVFYFNGWIGHNGGVPGYTTIAWHLRSKHLSLVVLVNSDIHVGPRKADHAYEPSSEIGSAITRILTPANIAPPSVKTGGTRVTDID